jgi:putative peptidoglycan lipid II flippase
MTDPAREGTDAAAAVDVPDAAAPATIGRASAILAAGTIVSRILGFVSVAILSYAIGVIGTGADAFALANQLPNNIYSLVAGGLLSAVIVPQIVKAGLHADGGTAFINRLVTLGVVVFLPLTIVAILCAPLLVRLYGGTGMDEDAFGLTTSFAYWCLPQIMFYALYSLVGETLNARGVFGPFTWAPALNNLVAIAGLLLFISLFGAGPQHSDAGSWTPPQIAVLAGSATLGIAVQAFGLFFFWRRAGLRYRPDFRWRGVGLGDTGRAAAWVFGMFLVSQVSGVVEARVAFEASGDDASVNALKLGWLMFMLPHSVVTVSIVTAYFTRMSAHVRDGRLQSVRDDLVSALKSILMIMVFAAVGLAVLAYPFSAIFAQSQYSGVAALAAVYVAFLTGLVPFTIFFVLLRVYYAVDDTRTAFVIQVAQTVFYIVGALVVQAFAPREWIAVGLALVLSAALAFQALLSAAFLRRRLGPLGTAVVAGRVLWYLGAAIPAAAAGVGVLALLGGVGPGAFPVNGIGGAIASMALAGACMALVYAAVLLITGNPEFKAFVRPVVARIRRRR